MTIDTSPEALERLADAKWRNRPDSYLVLDLQNTLRAIAAEKRAQIIDPSRPGNEHMEMAFALDDEACRAKSNGTPMLAELLNRAAVLLRRSAQQPTVPPGYALVPVEPTEEMLKALLKEMTNPLETHPKAAAWDGLRSYRAMLAAAPKQEERG